jgi:hypothetical protein
MPRIGLACYEPRTRQQFVTLDPFLHGRLGLLAGQFRPRAAAGTSRRSVPSLDWQRVYVAVGKRIAVLGAGMHLVAVIDRTLGKRFTEGLPDRRRGIRVLLGKAAIKLSPEPVGKPVRGIVSVGD